MSAQHLVSVVMVTCHTGAALDQAIASVLAQNADSELILVNNGNPAKVEASLVERFKEDPAVRLMTGHGDIGFARGCNLGARVASGDRLLFVSPFCVLPPDAVTRLLDQERHVKRPFLMGARLVDERQREIALSRRPVLTPLAVFVDLLRLSSVFPKVAPPLHLLPPPKKAAMVPAISRAFMYIPKEGFIKMGGFDEHYLSCGEDMDFFIRFQDYGGHVWMAPDIEVACCPPKAAWSPQEEKKKVKDMIHYLHDHFGASSFLPLLWALFALIGLSYWGKCLLGLAKGSKQEK